MRIQTVLIGILAVILGLAAALGVWVLIGNLNQPHEAEVEVVVAARDVPRFATLTPSDVKLDRVPKKIAPASAITRVEEALDRGTTTFVGKGEVLLESKVSARGVRGMAAAIPPGMRAVTIRTPDVSVAVAGFTLPGSKVDVLLTLRSWSGGSDPSGGGDTTVLMEKVEVLAVDQRVESPADAKVDERMRSVTLLVTPEQAAKLELGQVLGTLHLSLRHPKDESVNIKRSVTLREVRQMARRPDVKPVLATLNAWWQQWLQSRKPSGPPAPGAATRVETKKEVKPPGTEVKPPPRRVRQAPPIVILRGSSRSVYPVTGEEVEER